MEVHHHTHTSRKQFKHYLFEFLMLFLAVFLGFLAENFREHQVEKERGKQYIESFYEDLKRDTARIYSSSIRFDDTKINTLENLNACYDTVSKNMQATPCLLDIIKVSAINRPFKWTDRTLNQLANAGGFRLLQKEDADSIIAYQKEFNNFQDFQETVFQEAQNNVRSTFNLLINFSANAQMFKIKQGRLLATFDNKDVSAPVLFSNDKNLLNKFFNDLQLYYRVTYNHKGILLHLQDNQIRLINYFKNKYHFQ
ncbi:MAG: hypothetical protein ICV66_05910 [Chitinophagaceae bacterium]|nr:hypothetical protein [Chitinophagaceae bacterium]